MKIFAHIAVAVLAATALAAVVVAVAVAFPPDLIEHLLAPRDFIAQPDQPQPYVGPQR